jgi:acetyltransferase-like isoleucine patch superfamily enzyme
MLTRHSAHPTSEIDSGVEIGEGCRIWHHAQVRSGARLGPETTLGKGVYVDREVVIGARCKIQNGANLFRGTVIEDGVFVGPGAIITNDRFPRAINRDGRMKADDDWRLQGSLIKFGASIGAGAIIRSGTVIGEWALVGAGAVVCHDVPPHSLVVGAPAKPIGLVCYCGTQVRQEPCHICGWVP